MSNLDIKFNEEQFDVDFSDVKGHSFLKRAMEISASGKHHIIMVGSQVLVKQCSQREC